MNLTFLGLQAIYLIFWRAPQSVAEWALARSTLLQQGTHKALAEHRQAIFLAHLIFHIDFTRAFLGVVQLSALGCHAHPSVYQP